MLRLNLSGLGVYGDGDGDGDVDGDDRNSYDFAYLQS